MHELLPAVSAAVAAAASLLELSKNIKNAQLQNQIAELNVQLATVKNGTASLIKKNGSLKKKLDHLQNDKVNPLAFNSNDGLYYDAETEVPYCPNCYEGKGKERHHLKVELKTCPKCHEAYAAKSVAAAVAVPLSRRPLPRCR